MFKNALTTIALLLSVAYGHSQSKSGDKINVQIDTVKGLGNAPDTIITRTAQLSFDEKISINYVRDESAIQFLRPYFVEQIVDPGNESHPLYLVQIKAAQEKLKEIKTTILKDLVTKGSYADYMEKFGIATEADVNSITLVHIPEYYISPNIVLYKAGDNIAKYYNLSTGEPQYLLISHNKILGTLKSYNGKSVIRPLPHELVENYYQIKNSGKKPISLNQSVQSAAPKKMSDMKMFGYMEQGHLVYSDYSERIVSRAGLDQKGSEVHKRRTLQRAESSLADRSRFSLIQQLVDAELNVLKHKL